MSLWIVSFLVPRIPGDSKLFTGVIIGGILTIIATVLSQLGNIRAEERRWSRENKLRYDQERLRAYTNLYYASWPTNLRRFVLYSNEEKRQEETVRVARELTQAFAETNVLAKSNEVREAAKRLTHTANEHLSKMIAAGYPQYFPQVISEEMQVELAVQREVFNSAARNELGVSLE